jgi:hypothetical protein
MNTYAYFASQNDSTKDKTLNSARGTVSGIIEMSQRIGGDWLTGEAEKRVSAQQRAESVKKEEDKSPPNK